MSRVPLRLAPWLRRTGLGALLTTDRRPGLVVLAYHRIGTGAGTPGDPALFDATASEFDAQLRTLQQYADLVAPEDVADVAAAGGRAVLLTFDDAYADARHTVLPVLAAHGARAAFFVATGFVDRPRLPWWDELVWMAERSGAPAGTAAAWTTAYKALPSHEAEAYLDDLARSTGTGRAPASVARGEWCTWDDVRALRDAGMTLGAHTHDHPVLARAPRRRQARELTTGIARIEAETGVRARWLAYPVGQRDSFSTVTREVARDAGIELAFSAYGGWNPWEELDPLDVRRVYAPVTAERLRARVTRPALFA